MYRLMLLLFSTVACSRNMPQENVAARVFEEPITAEQVRSYVHNLPEELRVSGAAGERPREYLQPLIDRKLLVHEARARNIEDDLDYLRWHRQTVHNPAIRKVVEASAGPALEIGDAELRRYCESTQCDRAVQLGVLLFAARSEAQSYREELLKGEFKWEDCTGGNELVAGKLEGGECHYNRDYIVKYRMRPEVRWLAGELDKLEVSDVFELGGKYGVYQAVDTRRAGFSAVRDDVYAELYSRRMREVFHTLADSLREKCDVEPITEGWNALCYDAAGSCRSSKDGGAEGDAGVLRIGKDTLTVRQACVELGAAKGNLGGSADSARVAQLLESHVVPQLLILQEAETKGMVSAIEAELRGRSEEKLVEIMLAKELSRARTITIDDEEARQFYETHPEWFRTAEEITVQEILVAEAELALELKARIHAGEKMSELADQYTKRQTSQGKGGVFHFHSIESIRFGELARCAREAPIGELVGPIQVEEGHSVFKVLSRERKQLAWDKKQKLRAKLMLESAQKDSIRVAFVHALREKYSANVQVFDQVLQAMSRLEKLKIRSWE